MAMFIFEEVKNVLLKEFFAENMDEYRNFWQDIRDKYPGWCVDFVYRNCDPPMEFMKEICAEILESHVITILTIDNFAPVNEAAPTLVTAENFDTFAPLHENMCPDFAYPNERIAKDMNRWRIFMYGNAYTMMSFSNDSPEIFALEIKNAEEGAALLSAAAKYAFENDKPTLDFFIDDYDQIQKEAAHKVGFTVNGKSICYRVRSVDCCKNN